MKKIEVGKKYYFNNREIIVLKLENEQFAFVVGNLNMDHGLTGSNFCESCNIDSHSSHTCTDQQNTIDILMEELGDKEVFWVDIRYLNEHPFEYEKHVKLQSEIENLEKVKHTLNKESENIKNEITALKAETKSLSETITNSVKTITEHEQSIYKLTEERTNLWLDMNSFAKIKDTGIKITMSKLIHLYQSKIELESLKIGGVDNWQ